MMLFTRRTHAAWSADPVEVYATTALCPLVSAASDAAHGALIVWQEETVSGGLLRAVICSRMATWMPPGVHPSCSVPPMRPVRHSAR
jgi:hypothetical protein